MDQVNSITESITRKPFKHITSIERGMIEAYHRQGLKARAIAEYIGCSYTTIYNELKRGTPLRKGQRGRRPMYNAKYAQKAYESNRKRCHRTPKIAGKHVMAFVYWLMDLFHNKHFSIDACVGLAKKLELFSKECMLCTKTIYNMIGAQKFPISLFDLPKILSRRSNRSHVRSNKRILGRSIAERPDIAGTKTEFGHWEIDTVVGKKKGQEPVILTLLEKKTRYYIAVKISGKTSKAVNEAMAYLLATHKDRFGDVFKTITSDNGSEFSALSDLEAWGTKVYFAHPYSSSERGQNERHNGLLREFIPKGKSINGYSDDMVQHFADIINSQPRRVLDYEMPEELYEKALDEIYAL